MKTFIEFSNEISDNFICYTLNGLLPSWNIKNNDTYPCLECYCCGVCGYKTSIIKIDSSFETVKKNDYLDSEWEDESYFLKTCKVCNGEKKLNFHGFFKYYLDYCDQFKEKRKNMFEITNENFEKEVLQHKGKIMVKFGAEWCAPCKILDKALSLLDSSVDLRIVKVDIENSPELAKKYEISSIPCSLFFNDGKIKEKKIGMMREQDIINIVNRL